MSASTGRKQQQRNPRTGGGKDRDGGSSPHDVQLSKLMSFALRHGASELGLTMAADGYVAVDELLALPKFRKYTLGSVQQVVATNDKQRFALREDAATGAWYVRANQGHSLASVTQLELTPLTEAAGNIPAVAVHGTTRAAWALIARDGLRVMRRHHVHCAKGLPGADGVVSGMRRSSEVHVYVDVARAVRDGMSWFESANGVVLSAGFDGVIPPKYFARVTDGQGRPMSLDA
ncbi:tRNA 2'-phosphotransferase [Blastocladiella emersonii ATCC 22665]|nr:tRNA 2'-phosphotransferase [Blastocladiella emersonii ATCC 22665]